MTKLDELLGQIAPERTLDETARRATEALNSFCVDSAVVDDWDAFTGLMAELFCHIENTVLRLSPGRSVSLEFDWGRCAKALTKKYGARGEKTAFEIARTGNEGGLYAILKAVADQMAEDYAGNEISARVGRFWQEAPAEEKLASADEYIEKFGHLLPSELTENGGVRIKMGLQKVLEQHPRLIRKLRGIGR